MVFRISCQLLFLCRSSLLDLPLNLCFTRKPGASVPLLDGSAMTDRRANEISYLVLYLNSHSVCFVCAGKANKRLTIPCENSSAWLTNQWTSLHTVRDPSLIHTHTHWRTHIHLAFSNTHSVTHWTVQLQGGFALSLPTIYAISSLAGSHQRSADGHTDVYISTYIQGLETIALCNPVQWPFN